MKVERTILSFSPDHPAGAGHFPGNPIIPGALLLAETVCRISRAAGLCLDTCNVKSAKFFRPVRPGDTVEIEYSLASQQEVRFQCTVSGNKVLAGTMSAAAHA